MTEQLTLDDVSFVQRRDKEVFYSGNFTDDELISLVAQTDVIEVDVHWEFNPNSPTEKWHVQCYSPSFVGGFGLLETNLMRAVAGTIILGWLAERDYQEQ